MGLTMFLIWRQEFMRARDGDRFFYQRPNLFSRQIRGTMYRHGRNRMRDIILRNTKLSPSEVDNPWFGSHTRKQPKWKPFQSYRFVGGSRQTLRHKVARRLRNRQWWVGKHILGGQNIANV